MINRCYYAKGPEWDETLRTAKKPVCGVKLIGDRPFQPSLPRRVRFQAPCTSG